MYNGYLNTASVFRPESGTLNATQKKLVRHDRAASPTAGLFGRHGGSRAASPTMVAATLASAPRPTGNAARAPVPEELYEYSSDDALEESYVSRSGREIMFAV